MYCYNGVYVPFHPRFRNKPSQANVVATPITVEEPIVEEAVVVAESIVVDELVIEDEPIVEEFAAVEPATVEESESEGVLNFLNTATAAQIADVAGTGALVALDVVDRRPFTAVAHSELSDEALAKIATHIA